MKRHTLWLPILVLTGVIVALIIPGTLSSAETPARSGLRPAPGGCRRPWRREPPPPSSSRIRAASRRPRATRSRRGWRNRDL